MSFDQLGLSPELLRAVADQGYTEPTPVQAEAIPLVLEGRDVLAGAQTGTGKTAAFVLPILQRLNATPQQVAEQTPVGGPGGRVHRGPGTAPGLTPGLRPGLTPGNAPGNAPAMAPGMAPGRRAPRRPVRVLVLVPTRELALQVEESVRVYGAQRPIRSVPIYGGVGYDAQFRALRGGAEMVVATPGRLLDHIGQGTIDLSAVEILVLDEADRMLDMGFIRDIRKILAILPPQRQNLLFSATFSDEIRGLADAFLHNPAAVQVTPRNTATQLVRQLVIRVDRERKRDLLRELVASGRIDQALVFTRTKHGANRLAEQLQKDGITAAAIHGNRSQNQRVRALSDFKAGRVAILVATEVAARGIDIEELPHVVNYELPMVPEDYVHRIGRTGRAGTMGDAISLVCVDESRLLRDIETLLGRAIDVEVIPGYEPDRAIRPEPIRLRTIGGPGPRPSMPPRRTHPSGGSWPSAQSRHASGPARPGFGTRPQTSPARSHLGHGNPASGPGRPMAAPGRPMAAPGRPTAAPGRPAAAHNRPPIGQHVVLPGERIARSTEGQPSNPRPWGNRPNAESRPSAPSRGRRR
ncbi:MAG: DEAD/DEAH box helicase [Chloroflexota bacterium]